MNMWRMSVLATGTMAAMALAGCSLPSLIPEAKPDPTRFFILSNSPAETSAATVENAPTVQLRLEVASYARTRPMLVRRGDNELEFREFARWGEPIEQGIARVLREELLARGAGDVVVAGMRAGRETGRMSHDLTVRVLACEGEAGGGVNFRAVWELSPGADKTETSNTTTLRGDFRASGLRWDGKNEATLAAQLSAAVSGLAREIAGAWTK